VTLLGEDGFVEGGCAFAVKLAGIKTYNKVKTFIQIR
jgi:hypothetical protein